MKERVAKISILVNAILAGVKIAVGFVSSSSSVLAEGIHSFMDIISSTIGYLGIRVSKKPADKEHPYGYAKFEVLSGVFITIILFTTGAAIIYGAYGKFLHPTSIKLCYLSFGAMVFSAIVNEIMARIKIKFGKQENSVSLISDGIHSRIDVFTSLAVFVGLVLSKYFIFADSVLAFLIGLYIVKESFSIGKEAVDSLLDVSAGADIENQIKAVAKKQNIEIDSIKTQKKGSMITANLEIKLANNLSVEDATKTSEMLRERLMAEIENLSYVAIQIKSHDVKTEFYKPFFGRGFGWQKRGVRKKESGASQGKGSGGFCVCVKCGYTIPHEAGVPCSTLKCPKCKINLERK